MSIGLNLNSIKYNVVKFCFPSLKSAEGIHVKVLTEIVRAHLNGEKLNGYEIAKRIEGYGKSTVYKAINELKNGMYIAVADKRRSKRSRFEIDLYGPTLLGLVAYMVLVDYDLNILNKYFDAGDILGCDPEECALAKELVQKIMVDDKLKNFWNYIVSYAVLQAFDLEHSYRDLMESPISPELDDVNKVAIESLKKLNIIEYKNGLNALAFITSAHQLLLINPARGFISLLHIIELANLLNIPSIDYLIIERILPRYYIFTGLLITVLNIRAIDFLTVKELIEYLIEKLKKDPTLMDLYLKYTKQISLLLKRASDSIMRYIQIIERVRKISNVEELKQLLKDLGIDIS